MQQGSAPAWRRPSLRRIGRPQQPAGPSPEDAARFLAAALGLALGLAAAGVAAAAPLPLPLPAAALACCCDGAASFLRATKASRVPCLAAARAASGWLPSSLLLPPPARSLRVCGGRGVQRGRS